MCGGARGDNGRIDGGYGDGYGVHVSSAVGASPPQSLQIVSAADLSKANETVERSTNRGTLLGLDRRGEENSERREQKTAEASPRTGGHIINSTIPAAAPAAAVVGRNTRVVASGRAMAASPLWQQILADALGRTVLQHSGSAEGEETSLGVAILLSSLQNNSRRSQSTVKTAAGDGFSRCGRNISGCYDDSGSERHDMIVRTPNEEAFKLYSKAGEAQQRAYRVIFGSSDVTNDTVGGIL